MAPAATIGPQHFLLPILEVLIYGDSIQTAFGGMTVSAIKAFLSARFVKILLKTLQQIFSFFGNTAIAFPSSERGLIEDGRLKKRAPSSPEGLIEDGARKLCVAERVIICRASVFCERDELSERGVG